MNTLLVRFSRHYRLCKFSLAAFASDVCERDRPLYTYHTMRILLAEYKRYCHVNRNCLLSFPILCGVDVSYETLTVNPALCYRFLKFSLHQVNPDVIQPLALRTFTPSLPPHPYQHHSIAHTMSCFFSSQYITIPLQTTFLHFLGYFSHLCYPTNSFIPYSIQLGNSSHPFPQHFVISLLPMYIGFTRVLAPSYISCIIIT